MRKNNKYLAIIPARGGSKRLPQKNILLLAGKPLIAWTIEAALQSVLLDKVVVTSDNIDILTVAEKMGVQVLNRPSELAQDFSTSFDTVKHVIENIPGYEYTVLLQPTSPLRTSENIDEAIKLLETKQADGVISVAEVEHSPLWTNTLPNNNDMTRFLNEETLTKRSQDLPTYYRLNGSIYISRTKKLLEAKSFFLKERVYAYKMDVKNSVDIDTELDFKWAEFLCGIQCAN